MTERKKYKVVMCHVKGQSSGLETFRAPFCQTRSSRTGWINTSRFCFSGEPRTGSGSGPVHDSWSQHTPILRCSWTASPPRPLSAHTDRPQTLAQWQLVPVPNTGAPREPEKTASVPSPWSSGPAVEAGASLSPLVLPTRCRLPTAPRFYSRCAGQTVLSPWQLISHWIQLP